jgi:hypothetical protein
MESEIRGITLFSGDHVIEYYFKDLHNESEPPECTSIEWKKTKNGVLYAFSEKTRVLYLHRSQWSKLDA